MLWVYLAVLAYFISAAAFIVDKYLLSSTISRPLAYAFWAAILSVFAVVLIPFGVHWPSLSYALLSLAVGASFFFGLLFLYITLKRSDVSVATTAIGALSAIATSLLSVPVLHQVLTRTHFFAFLFLVAGIILLGRLQKHIFGPALAAGIFFGFFYTLLKLVFNMSDFINGIFWTRMGFVAVALLPLLFKGPRRDIGSTFHNAPAASRGLFVFNKVLSSCGFLLLYYAIRIGNAALVNALLGFQFIFVFILAHLLAGRFPAIEHNGRPWVLAGKMVGIVCTAIGFFLLVRK